MTAARRKKQEHTAPTIIPADNSAGMLSWNEVVLIWQFSSGRKILDGSDGSP